MNEFTIAELKILKVSLIMTWEVNTGIVSIVDKVNVPQLVSKIEKIIEEQKFRESVNYNPAFLSKDKVRDFLFLRHMPRPPSMTAKIDDEQRMLILRMYAEGHMPKEISKYAKTVWDIDYKAETISILVKKDRYQSDVKKFREDYMRRVKEVPIANKRIRIDDLEKVRIKIMGQIESNSLITKTEKEEFRYLVRSLNDTIINAREEMEKKPFLIAGVLGDFSDKSDDELIAEREEILKKVGRLIPGELIETSGTSEGIEQSDSSQSP